MKLISTFFVAVVFAGPILALSANSEANTNGKIAVLLVDGQNNHAWVDTSPVLKKILENSGKFEVTVSTSPAGLPLVARPPMEKTPEARAKFAEAIKVWEAKVTALKKTSAAKWEKWDPGFASCDVIISNHNGQPFPEKVQQLFES